MCFPAAPIETGSPSNEKPRPEGSGAKFDVDTSGVSNNSLTRRLFRTNAQQESNSKKKEPKSCGWHAAAALSSGFLDAHNPSHLSFGFPACILGAKDIDGAVDDLSPLII